MERGSRWELKPGPSRHYWDACLVQDREGLGKRRTGIRQGCLNH